MTALARFCAAALPAFLATIAVGCASVKPWQRARLATPAMAVPLAETALATAYEAKLLESKTGGGLPGTPAGGGCGCTQ